MNIELPTIPVVAISMVRTWWKAAAGLLAGLLLGWWLWRPAPPVLEPPAVAVRQHDSSLVLERAAAPSKPTPPAHVIPPGGIEERRVEVVVQGAKGVVSKMETPASAHHVAGAGKVIDSCICPPVTVDLSLVRMKDQTRRVVASSPNGKVLSGIDIPIEPVAPIAGPLHWTVSALTMLDADGWRPGLGVSYRAGPFALGGGAFAHISGAAPGAFASFGINF